MSKSMIPVVLSCVALFAGCDKKPDSSSGPGSAVQAPAAAKPAKTSKAPAKPKPAAKAQAKAELDKKPDAPMKGEPLTIPGTNGAFTVPAAWHKSNKGDFAVAASTNGEVVMAASAYAKGADPTPKLGAVASALELSDCEWKEPSDVTIGADDFPAKVADGVCQSDDKWVEAMYAMIPGGDLNVFVFGAVTEDAKDDEKKEIVDVLRSIHKAP